MGVMLLRAPRLLFKVLQLRLSILNLPSVVVSYLLVGATVSVKNDEQFKIIPVIVLTGSQADADTAKSYNLGANCFVQKPTGIKEFAQGKECLEVIARINKILDDIKKSQ